MDSAVRSESANEKFPYETTVSDPGLISIESAAPTFANEQYTTASMKWNGRLSFPLTFGR
jgi:hypothetical protein